MKIAIAIVTLFTSIFAAQAAFAGEDENPPCGSVSDATSKPTICDYECTRLDSNGACIYEYVCH